MREGLTYDDVLVVPAYSEYYLIWLVQLLSLLKILL